MKWKIATVLVLGLLLLVGLMLVGCGGAQEPCPECPEVECPECPEAECPECPKAECPEAKSLECPESECPECPECPEAAEGIPFQEQWAASAHADAEAEAFRHWDEDDPPVISAGCAKCHSEYGYLDFLGADGTEAGVIESGVGVGTVVSCVTCHNEATAVKDSVVFPSGVEITGLGPEARCMECHQGRASRASVDDAIAEAGLEDMDTTSEDLGFTNIHYYAAGATLYGDEVQGGYQFDGKDYVGRNAHVEAYSNCTQCHSAHRLEVKAEECSTCHAGVEDVADIRMDSTDYDGDGDTSTGISVEIANMAEALYACIQEYAASTEGVSGIEYDAHAYPYFFDEEGERYATWTPALLRGAYNYQYAQKDPGAFAHNPKYVIQALYDSMEHLGCDVSGMTRP